MAGGEVVDLVDEEDNVIGAATIVECLQNGFLHRAVAVLVMRSDGGFILQQRSKRDLWHPGLWTLSSTGHVKKGESYDSAAKRELREEIGIEASPTGGQKRLLPPIREGSLTEREWVAFYLVKSDDPAEIDPAELEGAREFSEQELRTAMDSGTLTPDAVIILKEFLGGL